MNDQRTLNTTDGANISQNSTMNSSSFRDPVVVLMTALLAFLMFVTLAGNFLLCRTILVTRRLWFPPYFFLASLAVADFLVGLLVLPVSLAYHVTYQIEGKIISNLFNFERSTSVCS